MVLLIDINVILDYLLKREPFYSSAKKVFEICSDNKAEGCIALHSVTTIWYILRKASDEQRRTALRSICDIFRVVGTDHNEVIKAIDNKEFKDFEDCMQSKCAYSAKADYIITRNIEDFILSEIPAISPNELIGMI